MPINTMAPWNIPAKVVEIHHTDADRFGHAVVIQHVDGERNQTYSNYLRKIPEKEAFKMILKSTEHG